jgi:hypothetical protein
VRDLLARLGRDLLRDELRLNDKHPGPHDRLAKRLYLESQRLSQLEWKHGGPGDQLPVLAIGEISK